MIPIPASLTCSGRKLLIEHKSYGKNLEKAYQQGLSYFVGLKEVELPHYVLVSDFERFKLYDLDSSNQHSFKLAELPDNVHLFDFIVGYADAGTSIQEIDLNIQATELLGKFHDALFDSGYSGHALEIFLVRVLFCLFAEDTGIFSRHQFVNYLLNYSKEDCSDTEMHLAKLFQRLKSDYQYAIKMTYNNLPWLDTDDKQQQAIASAAQAILDIRLTTPIAPSPTSTTRSPCQHPYAKPTPTATN